MANHTMNMTVNDTSVRSPHEQFYHNAQTVTGLICYPIICAFGLLGNICILVVLSPRAMRTSTNVYLAALAVTDIVKLLNDSLYFFTILLLNTSPANGNRLFGYLYPYAHFIFNMSVCVASWLTVAVAVERYIFICHPTQSVYLIDRNRAKWISGACWLVMTVVALPSAFRYRTVATLQADGSWLYDVEQTSLWSNATFALAYNWLQSLLRSMVPLVILALVNACIIDTLRRRRRERGTKAGKKNKAASSAQRITIMLIIVIICFLVCIIPDAFLSAFFNIGYVDSQDFLARGVREITDMLLAVSAAINVILYMIFNKVFRAQFLRTFCAGNTRTSRCRWLRGSKRDESTRLTHVHLMPIEERMLLTSSPMKTERPLENGAHTVKDTAEPNEGALPAPTPES